MKATEADVVRIEPGIGHHPGRPLLPEQQTLASHSFATTAQALLARATMQPDALAHVFVGLDGGTEAVSYLDLLTAAQRFAALFTAHGVGRGDRVIICMDTCAKVVAAFHGAGLIGAVPVMLAMPLGAANVPAWTRKLAQAIAAVGAKAALVDMLVALAAREPVIQAADCALLTCAKLPPPEALTPPSVAPDEIAYIQFTSGTTSTPKPVIITYGSLLANTRGIAETGQWHPDDLVCLWLPLFHDMGLVSGVLLPLLYGVPAVLLSPMSFVFTPSRWLWAIHYFRATLSAAPNFAYHICAHRLTDDDVVGLDLRSWRLAHNGAEFIHADSVDAFMRRFGPVGFRRETMYPVYGMAECVLAATFPRPDEGPVVDLVDGNRLALEGVAVPATAETPRPLRIVSVGRPFPGHELRIIDENGKALPERQQGHVELAGPSVTPGYFGDEASTNELMHDGWLRTGDTGYLADGRLYVYGRSKDIIIKAGRNYLPDSIERAAGQVEGVREGCVAAFGVVNEEGGTEDLVVVFETRRKQPDEISRLIRQVSATIKREVGLAPNQIVAVPAQSLPKTTSGKLRRGDIRGRLLAGQLTVLGPGATTE
ncbi:MAG: fatty acyl-AMP ligase [Myxococcales bacterium]|nr:fatty acyl-AMP ligase [Myxococcales bacterium]